MQLNDKIIVVTGGASGIGRAMVRRFAAEKPRLVVVADLDGAAAEATAAELGGVGRACNVAHEGQLIALIDEIEAGHGPIDLFCSNAGVAAAGGAELGDDEWQRAWDVNVMAHVWAARALVPRMLARGGGYLLQTASAAGLLTMVGAAPYSVSKHGAVAFAEWLSVTYGDRGLKVSCLCPLFVKTPMLDSALTTAGGAAVVNSSPVLEPDAVAEAVVAGLAAERFFILPHPEVAGFYQRRAADTDRWLASMRRLAASK